jgi:type I restriction enzyme S subunit
VRRVQGYPNGWRVVRFADVAESVTERVDDPSTAGVDAYVGLDHLDSDTLKISRWGSPVEVESTKLRFYPGDVIYARRRAYQRKLGVAEFEGICSAHALVLRARPDLCLPEFLPYFLQSDQFHLRALDISVGSLSPTINWKTLAVQEFALPPVEEQRQVAQLLAAADAVTDGYKRAVEVARVFERSHFTDAVKAWGVRRLGDVAGVSLGRQRAPKYERAPGQTRYLRAANVKDGRLLLDDVLAMAFSPDEVKRFELRAGDVVVTEGCGSIREIGANAVWNDELPGPICFQNTLIRLRTRTDELDQRYLAHWASNAYTSGLFASIATGTSILHLGGKRTADLELPLPPVDAQARLVEQFEAASALKTAVALASDAARELRQALLGSLLDGRA